MNKRYTKLSDIVEIISGGTPKTSVPEYWNGSIPWLAVNDFAGDSRWVYSAEKSVTELGVQKSATKILNKGDLIISARGTVGELAELAVPMAFNQSCFGLRGKNNTDTEYLYYLLKFNMPKIQVVANGATFGTIVLDTFDRIKLESFDNLNVQRKVSSILSRYDEAIENNSKRIKLLEQMAQSLYKEWFVRFRFPGWQNAEFENGMPKGWHQGRLSELLEFKRGKNITADEMGEGNVPVISAGLEPSGYHNQANVAGTSITISSSGANAGYLSIHYEDIWAADCMYVSESKVKNIYFVYELLNNFRPGITNLQRGAAQPHVYSDDINHLKLWIPNEELIEKANQLFELLHKQIYQLQSANQNLAKQRDLLLPRLMSGKLEV